MSPSCAAWCRPTSSGGRPAGGSTTTADSPEERLGEELAEAAGGELGAGAIARISALLASSARRAGAGAVASGRWLADVTTEMAGHLPVRELPTLEAQLGVSGEELQARIARNASIASAAVGATAGAAVAASQLTVPAWWTIPFELAVETVVIAGIEMKMLAELQATTGSPVTGTPSEKAVALGRAWAEGRGVRPAEIALGGGLSDVLGRTARDQLAKAMRRRLTRRMGRNLATLLPVLTGAAAAAEVNRRATLSLGEKVRKELAA